MQCRKIKSLQIEDPEFVKGLKTIKVEIKANKPFFFDNTYSKLICSTSTLNVTIILIKLVPERRKKQI
jgi:hypothetical protein